MSEHKEILIKQLEKIANEYNYKDAIFKIEATSSGGANYSSVLYNITISSSNHEELYLFAKVLNMDKNTRSTLANVSDTENFVYTDLATAFNKLEVECEVPEKERYVFPKLYSYNPNEYEETFILENLVAKGYEVYDRFKSIDWPYASKAVEMLAKYHALHMAYREQNPGKYNELSIEYTKKMDIAYNQMIKKFPKLLEPALLAVKEENKGKLQKFFDREFGNENVFLKYLKRTRKPILIHSDYRPSNIMHKMNKDGTVDLIPLDYQTIQSSSGLIDLLYFIFTGSDAQFRARYYLRLIDHYYISLRKALQRLRLDPDKIYSREDFDKEHREHLPYGLIMALFILPVLTVDPEDAPEITEDMFESLSNAKISKHYPDRLNGIIDDYVNWGIL